MPMRMPQGVLLMSGRWYYEFTVTQDAIAQIGWVDLEFLGSTRAGLGGESLRPILLCSLNSA